MTALELIALRRGDLSVIDRARATVDRQVRRMIRLVDDLLDVSRITRGQIELRPEPVSLGRLVSAALETTRPLIDERGHRVVVSLPESVELEADPVRLEQVLANLLNNAAKYTEPGGEITVEAVAEADRVVLRVKDTGIGIPPALLPRVFDLFVQGDRSHGRAQAGLGIGLTLVRRLVELHGGRVKAHSAGPGQGSELVVELPRRMRLAPVSASATAAGQAVDGRARRPRRILLVDDNIDAATVLAEALTLVGHEVRVAHDGPAAIEAALAIRPEVILLDLGLPHMDGCQVATELRARGLNEPLLVAVSGYGQESDRRRSCEAGFAYHLVKPVDLFALQTLLERD